MKGLIPAGIQRAALRYGPRGPDLLCPIKPVSAMQDDLESIVLIRANDILVFMAFPACPAFY